MAEKKETKTFVVETPVKDYCGVGAGGVQFANGKAVVSDGWLLEWFRGHGYKVTAR